ncbi:Imm61 family immunity protein [Arthrobacter sp. 31Y]|uniref:Imm61 family immunity protein n=1 Tax=Arthrobacter sp. 31Y TaxID=1115632 RepID=UPI0004632E37|nr:Imm61 family immunity protein [Arthrobacter sp. 31Y]
MGVTDPLSELESRIRATSRAAGIDVGQDPLDGTWFFTSDDVRLHLKIENESFVLGASDRGQAENHVFTTPLLEDMEKYLTYRFCTISRFDKQLPMLLVVPIPVTLDKVAPGFRIEAIGRNSRLIHHSSHIVRLGSVVDLVEFSHYVNLSGNELRTACMEPNGKLPFFPRP